MTKFIFMCLLCILIIFLLEPIAFFVNKNSFGGLCFFITILVAVMYKEFMLSSKGDYLGYAFVLWPVIFCITLPLIAFGVVISTGLIVLFTFSWIKIGSIIIASFLNSVGHAYVHTIVQKKEWSD